MASNTFIVSDESVNSYGFIVLTSGINTARFEKNPVMLYMHERESGIIGRWENIRVEDNKLLADAVFDENSELGRKVKERVESGFIRSASIGVMNIEGEEIEGVKTVIKCDLKEISIVDIPANENAVKLYAKNGKIVYNLSDLEDDQDLRSQIISLLGLDSTVSDNDILSNIKALLNSSESVQESVKNAVKMGFIDSNQSGNFIAMAASNPVAFRGFVNGKRKEQKTQLINTLTKAIQQGKIINQDRQLFESLAELAGSHMVERVIDCIPARIKLLDFINGHHKNRSNWKLNDYRKYAPDELRDNPALYSQLLEKEGRQMELNADTLEYYRRNNPDYLLAHPEEYQRLINNK